jgi:hypothetical protein
MRTFSLVRRHQTKAPLTLFSVCVFLVFLADSTMSYVVPLRIQAALHNTFYIGLLMSSSSLLSLILDVSVAKLLPNRPYLFYLKWLLIIVACFPLSFLLLPPHFLSFFISMVLWSLFYEFICFTEFNFVRQQFKPVRYAGVWSVLSSVAALGILLGSLVATSFLEINTIAPVWASLGFALLALICGSFFWRTKLQTATPPPIITPTTRSFAQELKIWFVLIKKVWPVYVFYFSFVMFESSLWTVGPLLAESIKEQHFAGGLLISAYLVPSLFTYWYLPQVSHFLGKKRTAFLASILGAGIVSVSLWFWGNNPLLVVGMLLGSLFLSMDFPLIEATFEDFMGRIDDKGTDLVGLQSSADSLAYTLGPLTAGGLGYFMGPSKTLMVMTLGLLTISCILLLLTPRKIKLPRAQLNNL